MAAPGLRFGDPRVVALLASAAYLGLAVAYFPPPPIAAMALAVVAFGLTLASRSAARTRA